MASKFVNIGFGAALKASLPIYLIFLITIAAAIFFPEVILWLPRHVFPESVGCFKAPGGIGYICP
jgi:C4-dicarboxylate transporter DctM subunit